MADDEDCRGRPPLPTEGQVEMAQADEPTHSGEPHRGGMARRLNWLRAAVLGSDDGIVSVAAIVLGVAGATSSRGAIFTAGLAGMVGGAVSMALGEYVSVSSQRDSETAALAAETIALECQGKLVIHRPDGTSECKSFAKSWLARLLGR